MTAQPLTSPSFEYRKTTRTVDLGLIDRRSGSAQVGKHTESRELTFCHYCCVVGSTLICVFIVIKDGTGVVRTEE